jgi:hypothetical protein
MMVARYCPARARTREIAIAMEAAAEVLWVAAYAIVVLLCVSWFVFRVIMFLL